MEPGSDRKQRLELLGGVPEESHRLTDGSLVTPHEPKFQEIQVRSPAAVSEATAWSYMTQVHILQSKKKPTHLIWFNKTTSSQQNC